MEKREIRIERVKPSSIAMFVGLLAAVAGFGVACAAWLGMAVSYTVNTDSLLRGMLFGFEPGLLAVFTTTILFYVAAWVIGYLSGVIFNWVAQPGEAVRQAETTTASGAAPRRAEPTFGETIGPKDDE